MVYTANLPTTYDTFKEREKASFSHNSKPITASLIIPDTLVLSIDETLCPTIYRKFSGKVKIANPNLIKLKKVEVFLLGESNFLYKESDKKRIYLKRSSHQHLFLNQELTLNATACSKPKLSLDFSFDINMDLPDSFHQKTSSNQYKIIANLTFEGTIKDSITQLTVEQPFSVQHKLIMSNQQFRKSICDTNATSSINEKEIDKKRMSKRLSSILVKLNNKESCFSKWNCFRTKASPYDGQI